MTATRRNVSRDDNRSRLIGFLETIRRPEVPIDGVVDTDDLSEVGLIDSLAILELIGFLEAEFGIDFRAAAFGPDQLRTIEAILDLIDQHSA